MTRSFSPAAHPAVSERCWRSPLILDLRTRLALRHRRLRRCSRRFQEHGFVPPRRSPTVRYHRGLRTELQGLCGWGPTFGLPDAMLLSAHTNGPRRWGGAHLGVVYLIEARPAGGETHLVTGGCPRCSCRGQVTASGRALLTNPCRSQLRALFPTRRGHPLGVRAIAVHLYQTLLSCSTAEVGRHCRGLRGCHGGYPPPSL
jgi:hypothetical protein